MEIIKHSFYITRKGNHFLSAMMANSFDAVLAFKCRLEKSHDDVIKCKTAIDMLINSNDEHSYVGSKGYLERYRHIEEKTFTMVTEVRQRISLIESKSSRCSTSYHTSSRSSYSSRSKKSCSLEGNESILKYKLDMNRLPMKQEDEHSKAAKVELEKGDSTKIGMEDNVLVYNSK